MFSSDRRFPLPCIAILFALLATVVGCGGRYPVEPPRVREVLHEVDAYRGEDEARDLSHTFSDDPSYMALGDRPTTAAVQFGGPICRITLDDVLLTTLQNNRNLRIRELRRNAAEEAVMAAKGIYDLGIGLSAEYTRDQHQVPSRLGPRNTSATLADTRSRSFSLRASVSQLVPTGGVLSLYASRLYQKNYTQPTANNPYPVDPYERVAVGASIVQPLLRNFGPFVTNAPIRLARLNRRVAEENFRDSLIEQLALAVQTYWDLVFAIDNYEVQRLALERARELLRITVIKRETGVEAPNVVLQAQAEVARREGIVIDARRRIADVSDSLKRLMNIARDSEEWNYNLVPVERPDVTPYDPNEEAAYQEALTLRPDYRSARAAREIAETRRRVAVNGLLPELNATANYEITGMEGDYSEAVDEAEDGDYYNYSIGLEFNYPLQNRAARGTLRQRRAELEEAEETLRNLEDVIRLDVRSALRALDTNRKLISAYEASVRAEEAKLDSQKKRYDVGFATIFEVLEFQEDLANAEARYIQAVIDYSKALIDLDRVTGSFLQKHRLEIVGEAGEPAP